MTGDFYREVLGALQGWCRGLVADEPFIHVPERRLTVHPVPLADYAQAPGQFAALSDAYEQQGIRLIHLWEDVWRTQQPIVLSRLRVLLGSFVRIHARQTVVRPIDRPALRGFLEGAHLHGSPQAKYKYGLYGGGQLVAAASFSAVRRVERGGRVFRSHELVRFASLPGQVVAGGLSRLLCRFVREVQPDDVMTYADRDWSAGDSYRLLGFTCTGCTPPQLFYVHPRELQRRYAHRLPEGVTEAQLLARGYVRIYNAGNRKYLKYFCTFAGV